MVNEITILLQKMLLDQPVSDWIDPQYWQYIRFLPVFLLSFVVTTLLTPLVGRFAHSKNIINDTKKEWREGLNKDENLERRINPNRPALLGGLAVLIPLLIFIPLFLGITPHTVPIMFGLVILTLTGVLDDTFNLPAKAQFLLQFIAAAIIAFSTIDLLIIQIPFDGIIELDTLVWNFKLAGQQFNFVYPGDILMILWIMVSINAIKWVAGIDALMESNMIIAFLLLFIIGLRADIFTVVVISALMTGSLAGFTIFNFPPAKIFTGSTGKTAYGFLVATLSMINETKMAVTILILLLPFADFVFVIAKRFILYRPRSFRELVRIPFELMRRSDTNHIHHQLLKVGFSFRQVLIIEISITLFVGSIAVLTTEAYRFFFVVLGGFVITLGILALHLLANKKEKEKQAVVESETPESKYSY